MPNPPLTSKSLESSSRLRVHPNSSNSRDRAPKKDDIQLSNVKTDPDIELSKEVSSTSTSLSTVVDKETSPMQSLIPRRGFVSLLRIDSLLESLETISDAKESKICRMIRRADTQGKYGHEFLLVETHDSLKHTLWIRLERAADLARRAGVWSRSSTFVPDDTARLASSLEDLIRDEGSEIKAEVEFTEPDTVTLYTLQLLLSCFIAESKKYTLVGENCWFFCSVVLSMLSERYPHRMKGTVGNWGHGLMDSRDRIQKVFLKKLVELGAISGPGIHEKGSKVQGDLSLQSAAGSVVSALGLTPRRHDSEETVVATNESYIHKGTTSNSTTSFGYVGSPFYCFSNFSPYPFTFKGKRYPTSQHLFVSLMFKGKGTLPDDILRLSEDPDEVSYEAERHADKIRSDWSKVKIESMEYVVDVKMKKFDDVCEELLSTGESELVYNSRDSFWGDGDNDDGKNELGKVLMRLRTRYREEDNR